MAYAQRCSFSYGGISRINIPTYRTKSLQKARSIDETQHLIFFFNPSFIVTTNFDKGPLC